MRRRLTLPLLLLGLLTLPVAADPRPDILYTSRREFVRVSPPRPLTLNAHIDKFAYDPLGLEVACTGSETQGGQTTYFVKTLDVRTGKELHRLALTVPQSAEAGLQMLGWTPSGKYLLLERTQPKEDASGDAVSDLVRWDLSADPPKVRPVEAPFTLPENAQINSTYRFASPHGRRVLLQGYYSAANRFHSSYQIYDAEQDSLRPLPRPDGMSVYLEWTDDAHLLVRSETNEKRRQMDVTTGQLSPLNSETTSDTAASKQFPDLTLTVDRKAQIDATRSGSFDSSLLWVRCAPRLKQPFSVVGAGLVMGSDDLQAVWSPTGKQIAFLNRGDLYVAEVALVPSEEVAEERLTLGLPLTCREERAIAFSRMKQIGLGIVQYMQDNDEKFPPAEGVDETIYPYLGSRSLYSVGKVHWVYHAPDNLSLAAMDAPADVVMGTMNLPCGQVVLYADGHVKEMTGKE